MSFDGAGNVGFYTVDGRNLTTPGVSGMVSASILGSTGDGAPVTIDALSGVFNNVSVGGAGGLAATGDYFFDPNNTHNMGGGFSLGAGTPGFAASAGCTDTTLHKIGNIHNFDDYVGRIIFGGMWDGNSGGWLSR